MLIVILVCCTISRIKASSSPQGCNNRARFLARGRKSCATPAITVTCFVSLGSFFPFLFCARTALLPCFFGCRYLCNRLNVKVRLWNDLLCVEWNGKPYSLTHSLTHPPTHSSTHPLTHSFSRTQFVLFNMPASIIDEIHSLSAPSLWTSAFLSQFYQRMLCAMSCIWWQSARARRFGCRGFCISALHVWNILPLYLKSYDISREQFVLDIKTWLFHCIYLWGRLWELHVQGTNKCTWLNERSNDFTLLSYLSVLILWRAEMKTDYTWPSRSNRHF